MGFSKGIEKPIYNLHYELIFCTYVPILFCALQLYASHFQEAVVPWVSEFKS